MNFQKRQVKKFNLFTLCYIFAVCANSFTAHANDYMSPEEIKGSVLINAEKLISMASEKDTLYILDSRIASDRKQGYIPSSLSLPDTYTDCETLESILPSKTSDVVFYCNGPKCRRSDRAVVIASNCGYSNIYWFRGGFEEWLEKSYSFTK